MMMMMMGKQLFLGAAAAVALAIAPVAAQAATWVTYLEWAQNGFNATEYGTVTLQEVDANNVKVTVALTSPGLFADNGNGHVLFGFNLKDSPESVVTVVPTSAILASQVTYSTSETADNVPDNGDFSASPFGHFDNAFEIKTSAPNTLPSPFVFNVFNASGITFAGVGATTNGSGQLTGLGTGNRFFSNSDGSVTGSPTGGWWFAADTSGTVGSGYSPTGTVAGRDAFLVTGVPEPTSWALMIMGFGGVGAMIRSRRKLAFA